MRLALLPAALFLLPAAAFSGAPEAGLSYGPRPAYLISKLPEGALKDKLQSCAAQTPARTDFSIGHRGAPLLFPEHTVESNVAAAQMGAGILECDVTFTKDLELVCRHAQNDLHTTTQYPDLGSGGDMRHPVQPGQGRQPGNRRMPHLRAHPGRIPHPAAQDGQRRQNRGDAQSLSGRHRGLALHPVRKRCHQHDPRGINRPVQILRRQVHAGTEKPGGSDALQRLHPGGLRPETD